MAEKLSSFDNSKNSTLKTVQLFLELGPLFTAITLVALLVKIDNQHLFAVLPLFIGWGLCLRWQLRGFFATLALFVVVGVLFQDQIVIGTPMWTYGFAISCLLSLFITALGVSEVTSTVAPLEKERFDARLHSHHLEKMLAEARSKLKQQEIWIEQNIGQKQIELSSSQDQIESFKQILEQHRIQIDEKEKEHTIYVEDLLLKERQIIALEQRCRELERVLSAPAQEREPDLFNEGVQNALDKANYELKIISKQLSDFEKIRTEHECKIAVQEDELMTLQDELQKMHHSLHEVESELSDAKTLARDQEHIADELRKESVIKEDELTALRHEKDSLLSIYENHEMSYREKFQEKTAELEELKRALKHANGELTALQQSQSSTDLQAELDKAQFSVLELEEQLSQLTEKNTNEQKEIADLKVKLEVVQTQATEKQQQLLQLEKQQQNMIAHIQSGADQQISEFKEGLQKAQAEVLEKEKELLTLKHQLANGETGAGALKAELADKERQLAALKHELANRETGTGALKEELEKIQAQAAEKEQQIIALKQEFETTMHGSGQEIDQLNAELKKQIAELESALQHAQLESQKQIDKLLAVQEGNKQEIKKSSSDSSDEEYRHLYLQLRTQFDQKTDLLHKTRKEIFRLENKLLARDRDLQEAELEPHQDLQALMKKTNELNDSYQKSEETIQALEKLVTSLIEA